MRSAEKWLSNLQLAIAELALLAALSAVGTVIEQNESVSWYVANFPDGPRKVLGFLDYHVLLALQLDHIYTAPYFVGTAVLLMASLIACSKTQQWPLLKIARRWRFPITPDEVFAKGMAETLPDAHLRDLAALLRHRGYQVFMHSSGNPAKAPPRRGRPLPGAALYAFKGISGRFAPIGVHLAMLAIMAGAALGVLGGYEGSVMLPEGGAVLVADVLRPQGTTLPGLALPAGADQVLALEHFDIDYRSDGSIAQYRSSLARGPVGGDAQTRKEIYVNEPMRFGGVTVYQTDWAFSAMEVRIGGSAEAARSAEPVRVPFAEVGSALGMNAKSKLYGTFIPLELPDGVSTPRGISVLAKDLQLVTFYDARGAFAGVRRAGSGTPLELEGQTFIVDRLVGASGLQLKHDPGVATVYAGFAALMLTTVVSYTSFSQVWALQDGGAVHFGGRSNRAVVGFQAELGDILDAVPERGAPAGPAGSAASPDWRSEPGPGHAAGAGAGEKIDTSA